MDKSILKKYRITPTGRYSFSRIPSSLPVPHLIELQKRSYREFLQMELLPDERKNIGLQAVFNQIFPIIDYRNICQLEFIDYTIGTWACLCEHLKGLEHLRATCKECGERMILDPNEGPDATCSKCGTLNEDVYTICPKCQTTVQLRHRYTDLECKERGATYSAPLYVRLRLSVMEKSEDGETLRLKESKEQNIYFGEIPLMTERGTFIINGTERVIVSQLHRSPGVYFRMMRRRMYMAEILPYYGAWVEFMFDRHRGVLYVRVDRRKKMPGTVLLKVFGFENNEELLRYFYKSHKIRLYEDKVEISLSRLLMNVRIKASIVHPETGEVLLKAGEKLSRKAYETLKEAGIETIVIRPRALFRRSHFAQDIIDEETGEVLVEIGTEINAETYSRLLENGIEEAEIFLSDREPIGDILINTIHKDKTTTRDEAFKEFFKKLRPGDTASLATAQHFFQDLFFNPRRYNLTPVGRMKINEKFGLNKPETQVTLDREDILAVVTYLMKMRKDITQPDDIDSLANRRIRAVGELLQNQVRVGLARMERFIKEKLSTIQTLEEITPSFVINSRPVMNAIREFFATGQLSQFMDQTNPLAEITHKRRLSALGPGGLKRERAGFEVRDVHPTHYGRICPIETPEGPNIGLITSLSCYAQVDEYGFIKSPYRKVMNGRVVDYVRILYPGDSPYKVDDVVPKEEVDKVNKELRKKRKRPAYYEIYIWYLNAWEEERYVIAQATIPLNRNNEIIPDYVIARKGGEFTMVPKNEVQFIDVSPKQVVSVSASLIPFLEHDDANRALMGSNMQRQSVPLMVTEPPYVGTGMEAIAARDSGAIVVADEDGVVESIDSTRIVIRTTPKAGESKVKIYKLRKMERSNQGTWIHQRPIVKIGDRVKRGQVIADGPATARGELALGKNVLVAYMPWMGYNFEDAIVLSERLVEEDAYTSVHIEEFEIQVRETKIGSEQLTRDIPNVSPDETRYLDESGIVYIGTYVKPGDILVGKATPIPETVKSPEEKLLEVIFGEKAKPFKDTSLRVPPGVEGVVVDIKIFTRRGVEKDKTTEELEKIVLERLHRDTQDKIRVLRENTRLELKKYLVGATLDQDVLTLEGDVRLPAGHVLTEEDLDKLAFFEIESLRVKPRDTQKKLREILRRYEQRIRVLYKIYENKMKQLSSGDELPPGTLKVVKVYVAMKRKLQVGDKMAGRHGNKGVIAIILPKEDMPFLPDGTPVDIVLNPLGVPSRMNVGQLYEARLGMIAKTLGVYFETPVFDGAKEKDIRKLAKAVGLPEDGKMVLYDGRTGEPFKERVTVGYAYMMKLIHMAEDKIHARATGPYSLITQQPLGGKARYGGQRLGEMEVWALEAYGAANILQEMLTVKSDDIEGRLKLYESILRGHPQLQPNLPESFRVLVKELQSLGLNVELITKKEE